ncbi:MAG: hypothetical protein V4691_06695 [Pseudomonadota bacterium]
MQSRPQPSDSVSAKNTTGLTGLLARLQAVCLRQMSAPANDINPKFFSKYVLRDIGIVEPVTGDVDQMRSQRQIMSSRLTGL